MKRILASFLLVIFLTGCAATRPYLVPMQTGMADSSQYLTYDGEGRPYLTKQGKSADVKAGTVIGSGYGPEYLTLDITVANKSQETLEIGPEAVTLMSANGVMVTPASMREMAYRTKGVTPPEQKDTGTKTMERGLTFLTAGVFALGESMQQQEAQRFYSFLTQNAFRNYQIPSGAKANGILCYETKYLVYPVKVRVNVKDESFEFVFTKNR